MNKNNQTTAKTYSEKEVQNLIREDREKRWFANKPTQILLKGEPLQYFETNNFKYRIIKQEEIGIERWNWVEKMNISLGFGKSFQEFRGHINKATEMVLADKPFPAVRKDLVFYLDNLEKSILELSEQRYNMAFYLFALIAIREGEDLTVVDTDFLEEKIKDFNDAGVSAVDVFFLTNKFFLGLPNFSKNPEESQEKS